MDSSRDYLVEILRVLARIMVNIGIGFLAGIAIENSYIDPVAATGTLLGLAMIYYGVVKLFDLDMLGHESIAATLLVIGVGALGMIAVNTYKPTNPLIIHQPQLDPHSALMTIGGAVKILCIALQVLEIPKLIELSKRYAEARSFATG